MILISLLNIIKKGCIKQSKRISIRKFLIIAFFIFGDLRYKGIANNIVRSVVRKKPIFKGITKLNKSKNGKFLIKLFNQR